MYTASISVLLAFCRPRGLCRPPSARKRRKNTCGTGKWKKLLFARMRLHCDFAPTPHNRCCPPPLCSEMVNIHGRRCHQQGCDKQPTFGRKGHKVRRPPFDKVYCLQRGEGRGESRRSRATERCLFFRSPREFLLIIRSSKNPRTHTHTHTLWGTHC